MFGYESKLIETIGVVNELIDVVNELSKRFTALSLEVGILKASIEKQDEEPDRSVEPPEYEELNEGYMKRESNK